MIKFFNYFFEGEEKKKMKLADNVPQLYLVGFFSPLNKGDVSGVGRVFERWLVVFNLK